MFIQTREFGYGMNYQEVFDGLKKWKAAVEQKYPEISITLMYNLAGERGRVTIMTKYPTLADYERIDAALDDDEAINPILQGVFEYYEPPMIDEFYKVLS